ncbi:MAG TPA: subclass B3 metallo-beta-lactamase [Terriglobia bacterium]|nr:subclass B3 metallo-beta-lactamase [Terriglobia bacterium]
MSYNRDNVTSKKRNRWLTLLAVACSALLATLPAPAQTGQPPNVKPFTPFKIIGNIYYVGDTNEAVYLITTRDGHILLDTGYAETVPIVKEGVEKLGFRMRDIKIMISGHAHSDHVAGHALVKEMTGARVLASELDAVVIESGGARGDYRGPRANPWTPAKVDQIIRDGEKVTLGGTTLVAHLTPGHTRGNTTWTTVIEDRGAKFNVAFMPSVGRNEGVHVFNYPNHPTIAEDYQKTFRVLKTLPCEVFLGPHGNFFDLNGKFARMQAGAKENPFIDPVGCRQFVARGEAAFLKQLEEERQTRK